MKLAGLGDPVGFAVIGLALGAAFSFLYLSKGWYLRMDEAEPRGGTPNILVFLPITVLFGVLGILLEGVLAHAVLVTLKAAKHPCTATLRAVLYVRGAVGLCTAVPYLGGAIGSFMGIGLLIVALAALHRTSYWKAAIANLLVPLVLFGGFLLGRVGWTLMSGD
jgi:hypothetical protein